MTNKREQEIINHMKDKKTHQICIRLSEFEYLLSKNIINDLNRKRSNTDKYTLTSLFTEHVKNIYINKN